MIYSVLAPENDPAGEREAWGNRPPTSSVRLIADPDSIGIYLAYSK